VAATECYALTQFPLLGNGTWIGGWWLVTQSLVLDQLCPLLTEA